MKTDDLQIQCRVAEYAAYFQKWPRSIKPSYFRGTFNAVVTTAMRLRQDCDRETFMRLPFETRKMHGRSLIAIASQL